MRLCDDEIWTVRRACAEVMPIMALLCTLEKRRKVLVPAMKKFMFDPSQWVIMAALKVSFPGGLSLGVVPRNKVLEMLGQLLAQGVDYLEKP